MQFRSERGFQIPYPLRVRDGVRDVTREILEVDLKREIRADLVDEDLLGKSYLCSG